MDTQTAFVAATLMTLINGAVLGLLHRELPANLRMPALHWLTGTLLLSLGALVYTVQDLLPLPLMVALANGTLILGFTAYWHSLRQFYHEPALPLSLLPLILSLPALLWYATVNPHTGARVLIASLAWIAIMGGSLHTLLKQAQRDPSHSRRVLTAIYAVLLLLTLLRAIYLVFVLGIAPEYSIVSDSWTNLLTPMLMAVLPVVGTTVFLLMCSERLRHQWERAASTDFLTGLANRRSLVEIGNQRLANTQTRQGLAVALIDIDHFKPINDAHGHDTGDIALRHVARLLQDNVRAHELVARLGGEEFVVLLDHVNPDQARMAGERLRRAVEGKPFRAAQLKQPLTISVGIALYEAGDMHFNALLQRADQAMYQAKTGGRNRVVLARPAHLHDETVAEEV